MKPKTAFDDFDMRCMKRALELAKKGNVSPNPKVGAIITQGEKIMAEAYHDRFGGDHAEVAAIKKLNKTTKPLTLFVSLEPCVHFGKTPPCVSAILQSQIKRVVVAMKDPNPKVNGKGIDILKKTGIKVEVGCRESEAVELNRPFIKWITKKLPFVTLKIAMSLDGKIATRSKQSKWITSEAARKYAKKLRDDFDAILVGKNTVQWDNPGLSGSTKEPVRIILDSNLQTSTGSKVYRNNRCMVFASVDAPQERQQIFQEAGIPVVLSKKITLKYVMRTLASKNITGVLIEGGAQVFGSSVDERILDRVFWFIAPTIIGGEEALPAVLGKGARHLNQTLKLNNIAIEKIGRDFLIQGDIL